MVSIRHLLTVCFAGGGLAASCWRNSTCISTTEASFRGPWEENIFAPETRDPRPKYVVDFHSLKRVGDYHGDSVLQGNGSAVVLDFGIEVGGVIHLDYKVSGDPVTMGLAFTEAKTYVGYDSDDSNGNFRGPGGVILTKDGALHAPLTAGSGSYASPTAMLRGGFRYLTVFILTNGTSKLELRDLSVEIVFQPTWSNLRAYQGYFHSNDDDLNKIWYSGAYTVQTDASPPDCGRPSTSAITHGGWLNNETIGVGESVMLDGAKRDRWAWAGDMGVSVPTALYATGDVESSRNGLQTIFDYQNKTSGALPNAGPPDDSAGSADAYHMWAMIGIYNYYLFTGDDDFLYTNWADYKLAMDYILSEIESDGILQINGEGDWGRYVYSRNGSEPNMLLYRTLKTGASLAEWASSRYHSDAELTHTWNSRAEDLRQLIFKYFWDEEKGAFFDGYMNRTLYAQDGNSYSVAFGVALPGSREAARVSAQLTENWTPIGPACPELPDNISPFVSSIELQAHFLAGRPDLALQLVRASWGWYLHHPNGTGSTVIEGYATDGSWGYREYRGYTLDPSYVSHSHGWSSGPTTAMTHYLVGLSLTQPAGAEWQLASPAFGVVSEAQTGFTTPRGKFSAGYVVEGRVARVWWDAPKGTRGWVDMGREKRWVEGGKGQMTVMVD